MRAIAVISLAVLASCSGSGGLAPQPGPARATAAPAAVVAPTYRVEDATGAFWTFWERAEHADRAAQVRLFREAVVAANPRLFAPTVVGIDPTKRESDLDERLPRYLPELPARIATMRRLTQSIRTDLARYDASFRSAFPDMRWAGKVVFTVSVDAFDGAVRHVDDEPTLLFGIDKIAKIHGDAADLGPLFHHELFHVYQDDVNPAPAPAEGEAPGLLMPLWTEGLAVYVSRVLNPSATWKQVLFSEELHRDGSAKLAVLARELRTQLDHTTEETYRDFFLGAGKRADIPKRSAYLVGYRVAERLAKGRSLRELARLKSPELRKLVDGTLSEMEHGR